MNKWYILFTILWLSVGSVVQAGNAYRFRTLSPEGGFYFDGVKSIQQDKDGFIWIVMDNELYRFDGYEYKRYYNHFAELDKSKGWIFYKLVVSSSGELYVSTNNGIYQYNKQHNIFNLVRQGNDNPINIDTHDNLWIRQPDGWAVFNPVENTFISPLYNGKKVAFIGPVFCQYNNDLYVFSNYGQIYRYNYAKKEFFLTMKMPHSDGYIINAKAHKGKLWVLVKSYGLYRIDLSTFTIEEHIDLYNELGDTTIRAFHIDKTGKIWLGTLDGLYIINPETKAYSHYLHSRNDEYSIPNNSIWTISEDLQQNIWIGTYSGSICYVNLDEKNPFESFRPQLHGLNHSPVSAFAEDDNSLWIATEGGGINRMDKITGQFDYSFHTDQVNSLAHNNVKTLTMDRNKNLWIGMFKGGLNKYNIKTGRFKHFIVKDQNSIYSNNIRKLVSEGDTGLWIAYQHQNPVISYLSFHDESITHYTLGESEDNEFIFDVIREGENQLWMISNQSIFRMDVREKAVRRIPLPDSTLVNFRTFCLDDSGNLWIGTSNNGLVKYNPYTDHFSVFGAIQKYGIYSIFSICNDNEGNLWLGTDNGLIRYNIAENSYSRYDKQDGVQGNVFYPLAVMKSVNGLVYVGGTEGFIVVNSKEIGSNNFLPKVIISDFLIDHASAGLNLALNADQNLQTIELKHNQANFGFVISSDNFLIPEKNRFKYRLVGYNNQWIEVAAKDRNVFYSKVPPGNYYFEVVAANNDGIWSDKQTSIKIVRKPAPWFSWPAYVLYVFVILVIIYVVIKNVYERKKLQLKLYFENIEKEKNEEIHKEQLNFFTNISHDFKTPLSLITAALHKLRQEGLKEYYYRILNNNSQRLIQLVNELMDFRTVENGKMNLIIQPIDINQFILAVSSDFNDYAAQKNIKYEIKTDPELRSAIYADKNILEKIVLNLLNNAFNYTRSDGQVKITTNGGMRPFQSRYHNSHHISSEDRQGPLFQIIVSDTGIGIAKDSISKVFDKFYKINNIANESYLGTGIGLALVKSLVLLHKGKIEIFSEQDKGTDIIVSLPLHKGIYNEECIKEYSEEGNTDAIHSDIDNETTNDPLEKDISLIIKEDKKRILLVEDNEDLRNLIADFLSSEYEIIEAGDGLQASKILASRVIDFVISDIMMPLKDGIALSREIKNNVETSHIPVMLLTAKTGLESNIEGVDSGADLYFEKPIDLNLLRLNISNVFQQRQQLKEYYAKNYYADSVELTANERDTQFMKDLVRIIDDNIDQSSLDVNFIASELSMSRSKLYRKIKTMTDKSIVEFILSHRLRKAARIIIEDDVTMRQVMERVGIESQPYFTNAFKKEFGETPTSFASKYKSKYKSK